METGALIRDKRKKLRLTLKELAHIAGIAVSYLSDIERGKKQSTSVIERLNHILDAMGSDDPIEVRFAKLQADYEAGTRDDAGIIDDTVALHASISDKSTRLGADINAMLGWLFFRTRRFEESYHHALTAYRSYLSLGDAIGSAKILTCIATIDYQSTLYSRAIEIFKQAIQTFEENDYRSYHYAKACSNLAMIGSAIDDLDIVTTYLAKYNDCMPNLRSGEIDEFAAKTEYLLGYTRMKAKSYGDAIDSFRQACYMYRSMNQHHSAISMQHNIAEVYMLMGDIKNSRELLLDVLAEKRKMGRAASSIAITLAYLSDVEMRSGNEEGALAYCKAILEMDGVAASERAKAYRNIARMKRMAGDMGEFTRCMTYAMGLLKEERVYRDLWCEIVTEYAEALLPGETDKPLI